MEIEAAITAIQPPMRERRAGALRRVARHAAQYQMASHCVAHSWQSDFVHCMQTANAGRCGCTAHRCAIARLIAGFMEAASLAGTLTAKPRAPILCLHMTAFAPRFAYYYGYVT